MASRTPKPDEPLKFLWLDPDSVLDIGYALYTADNPDVEELSRKFARKVVAQFQGLREPRDPRNLAYLHQTGAVALSFARALGRRKGIRDLEIESARKEYAASLERYRDARTYGMGMTVALKLFPPAAFFALGASLARSIVPFIPNEIAESTGKGAPSLFIGLVFMMIGWYVKSWWADYRRQKVSTRHHLRVMLAVSEYERAKLSECQVHREKACVNWREYTGKPYRKGYAAYTWVMEADHRVQQLQQQAYERHIRGELGLVTDLIHRAWNKRFAWKKRKVNGAPVLPLEVRDPSLAVLCEKV